VAAQSGRSYANRIQRRARASRHVPPVAHPSGSNLGDAHLLEQCQIIFDMPVVGDAAVLDLDEVGGDEGNGLALTPRLTERAAEVSGKAHVYGDIVAGDNHLLNGHREVAHGGAELARSEGRPLGSLWTAGRQGAIGESRRDSLLQQGVIAGVPEIVERAGSVDGRIALRVGDRCSDDEFVDLDAVGGEGGC
jgi:hypothetical protein